MSTDANVIWWRVGLTLLGMVLIGVAIGSVLWSRRRSRSARSWVGAPGVILWSNLRVTGRGTTSTIQYFPEIEYSFYADGERHGTTAFLLGKIFSSRAQGEAWLRSVAPNTPVQVWFDPLNPDRSALINNEPSLLGPVVGVLTGVAVIAAGWLVTFTP